MMNNPVEKRVRAFFFMKTRFENIGDALINRELLKLVSARVPVTVDLSRAPEPFAQNLDLAALPDAHVTRHGLAALVFAMLRARRAGITPVYFLMPGGNRGEKSWPLFAANMAYNVFLGLLRKAGIQLVQTGVSFEHLGPRYGRVIRDRARTLSRIYVRDRLSADLLERLGIRPDGILPDLAFNVSFDTDRLERQKTGPVEGTIGLSFRTGASHATEAQVRGIVDDLAARFPGRPLKFVAQVKSDLPLMQALARDYAKGGGRVVSFFDMTADLSLSAEAYGDCAIVFSNRLHVLLLSLSMGAIPAAVIQKDGDLKIRGVFEAIGLASCLFDIDGLPMVLALHVSDESLARIAAQKAALEAGTKDMLLRTAPIPGRSQRSEGDVFDAG